MGKYSANYNANSWHAIAPFEADDVKMLVDDIIEIASWNCQAGDSVRWEVWETGSGKTVACGSVNASGKASFENIDYLEL